jgi:hypothetical protein
MVGACGRKGHMVGWCSSRRHGPPGESRKTHRGGSMPVALSGTAAYMLVRRAACFSRFIIAQSGGVCY